MASVRSLWVDYGMYLDFLVNGLKYEYFFLFIPLRGLRQRDSLSPYISYCAKMCYLDFIKNELMKGNFSGVKMNKGGIPISHVMYANDIMIFSKANTHYVEALNDFLEKYSSWLG